MKRYFKLSLTTFLFCLGLGLAACDGRDSRRVALAEIPVVPLSRESSANENPLIAEGEQILTDFFVAVSSSGVEITSFERKAYILPANTTWQRINDFYEPHLLNEGWRLEGATTYPNDSTLAMWLLNSQQALVIAHLPTSTEGILIVSLLDGDFPE